MSKAKVGAASAAVLLLAGGLIAKYEGYVGGVYTDPIGIPTSCYGHVGPENTPGRKFTRAECKALLDDDIAEAYGHVRRCIRVPLKDNETASLVSAVYNIGPRIVCNSTLGRLANEGASPNVWCKELLRWDRAGGRKLRGLTKRREAETRLCLGQA